MKVFNELQAVEKNGEKIKGLDYPVILINSHHIYEDLVIFVLPDKTSYTIPRRDLTKAIANATNHK